MLARFYDLEPTFSAFNLLRRRVDRVLDELDGVGVRGTTLEELTRSRVPALTLTDAGGSLLLRAEVPGLEDKELQLTVHRDVLTLKGERRTEAPAESFVHRKERSAFKFSRTVTLPCAIDPERCKATLKHGVLTVELTKAADAQPRAIAVKSH